MLNLMYSDKIIEARNEWSRRGHTFQLEYMLKSELNFVDFSVSRAEHLENKAALDKPPTELYNWQSYEMDYYRFVKDYIQGRVT